MISDSSATAAQYGDVCKGDTCQLFAKGPCKRTVSKTVEGLDLDVSEGVAAEWKVEVRRFRSPFTSTQTG